MRWMWIDQIVEFVDGERLSAIKNVSLAEEHLHDHFAADERFAAEPVMPSSLMIEGMAQTAGILVGAVNRFREKVVLAKIVKASITMEASPGATILYAATLDRIDAAGAATSGQVSVRQGRDGTFTPVGAVDLMFSHIDHNLAGMEFPEENFVFSDNFRTILNAAGLDRLVPEA